jgi:hypothetical protein
VTLESVAQYDPKPQRRLPSTAFSTLGETGSDGALASTKAFKVGQMIRASKMGYSTSDHTVGTGEESRVRITLERGGQLSVACKLRDGTALAGVEVVLSEHPMPAREQIDLAPNTRPGTAIRAAVYSSTSDMLGHAEVTGLPPGQYYFDARHEDCVLVSGPPLGRVRVAEGEAQLAIELDPVYCALANAVGVSLISWSCDYPDGLVLRPDLVGSMERIISGRKGVGDNWVSIAGVAKFANSKYQQVASEAVVTTFTKEYGWADARIPVQRVSRTIAPYSMTVQGAKGVNSTQFLLVLADADGQEITTDDVQLIPFHGDSMSSIRLGITSGKPRVLPDGRYAISTSQPFLRKAVKGEIVTVGQEHQKTIVVPEKLIPCILTARFDNGLSVDSGTVTFICGQRTEKVTLEYGLSQRKFLLPLGVARILLVGAKGSKSETDVNVSNGIENQIDLGTLK